MTPTPKDLQQRRQRVQNAVVVAEDDVFRYLFSLQASGITNMFASPAYVTRMFKLSTDEAEKIVLKWMNGYSELKTRLMNDADNNR